MHRQNRSCPIDAKPLPPRPSREEAEKAVHTLLRWAGDDPAPRRACATRRPASRAPSRTGSRGYGQDPEEYLKRTFEEIEGYDDMVVLKDIRFESHCEHHLAPIIGRAHVGYLPTKRWSAFPSWRGWWKPMPAACRCRRK